ncbi:MAG: hypothetical protein HQL77_12755 [Magnetococcales bacterium]|nr:hypothetical protein [Magnetococcales bacterium]
MTKQGWHHTWLADAPGMRNLRSDPFHYRMVARLPPIGNWPKAKDCHTVVNWDKSATVFALSLRRCDKVE